MPRTPGMPTYGPTCVDRVRNDGHWIVGDPLDTDYRPWMNGAERVLGNPGLTLYRQVFDTPVPVIPGWRTPTTGFAVAHHPTVLYMTYYPIDPRDPEAPAEQLVLF